MKALRPLIATLAAVTAFSGAAHAQATDWPTKPITMIVPYAPGGFADTRVRLLARKLGESLGQPIVVENKAGAGGVVGTSLIAKAAPDGYTIGTGNLAPMAVNPTLMKDMPYNPQKDLAPIILIENSPLVLSVNNELPVKTLADLIALAKKEPGSCRSARPAWAARITCRAKCSVSRPRSTSCTCPTRAAAWPPPI